MTFFPDGETEIPNQTPIPSTPADRARAHQESGQRLQRLIVRTAIINAALLAAAVLAAYVFPVTDDPDMQLAIVVGAALLGGVNMTVTVLREQQRRRREAGLAPGTASPPGTGDFALEVDHVFSITGRGTVVTGRVATGELRAGQRVLVTRAGQPVAETEVTRIEKFRERSDVARAGENVGLLMGPLPRDQVQRGDMIVA